MPRPRMFLLPGFALDARVFEPMSLPKDRIVMPDLIPLRPYDTLATYAERLLQEAGCQKGDLIAGVSLGGMLALEGARFFQSPRVALIASAVHPSFLRLGWRALCHVAPNAPDALIAGVFSNMPRVLRRLGLFDDSSRDLLTSIMCSFPPELLRRLPPLIATWPGYIPTCPLYRFHADSDWMFRFDGQGEQIKLIKGVNHLLPISHPQETREFLLRFLDEP